MKVAFIGNHTPRRCGIATFTADLALAVEKSGCSVGVFAMEEQGEIHDYPNAVRFKIRQERLECYTEAARIIAEERYEVACLQHEYGIYGGDSGEYILHLLRELRIPIVTTLHTILREPTPTQKRVMDEILQLSERVVVMTEKGREILVEVHDLDARKVTVVPHGIPVFPQIDRSAAKESLGLEGRPLLFTFGLVAPDKGLQYMVEALPKIVAKHPNVLYLVAGVTHPKIKAQAGEDYRRRLLARAKELGVAKNLRLDNRFLSNKEIVLRIQACDAYVTPYLKREQITSGTLSYAFGCGRAVVSTPYWHAEELLADGRGSLVSSRDSNALGVAINEILGDQELKATIEQKALALGSQFEWPVVGKAYRDQFEKAILENEARLKIIISAPTDAKVPTKLPALRFDHLWTMVDDTGMFQHATFDIPKRSEGYCTDDNARALQLALDMQRVEGMEDRAYRLANETLSFLELALTDDGHYHNFMSFDRRWLDEVGSEDSHGRALRALGAVVRRSFHAGHRTLAASMFVRSIEPVTSFTSPRAWAFTLLGIRDFCRAEPDNQSVRSVENLLSALLNGQFERYSEPTWLWFENSLTYDNARLPEALIASGNSMGVPRYVENGLASLHWLVKQQKSAAGHFSPIGSDGFYVKNSKRASFDQQPLEAWGAIEAYLEAYRATEDRTWVREARRAFDWFVGANDVGQSVVNEKTGGGYDGLCPDGPNLNQGAESTLSYLAARIAIDRINEELVVNDRVLAQTTKSVELL